MQRGAWILNEVAFLAKGWACCCPFLVIRLETPPRHITLVQKKRSTWQCGIRCRNHIIVVFVCEYVDGCDFLRVENHVCAS